MTAINFVICECTWLERRRTGIAVEEERDGLIVVGPNDIEIAEERRVALVEGDGGEVERRGKVGEETEGGEEEREGSYYRFRERT